MPQPGRADQVYQLTLTELAFIVIFLILLLSGWMIVKTDDERAAALREKNAALARLAELPESRETLEKLETMRDSLAQAEQEIRRLLAGQGMADPDAIVSELARKAVAEAENLRLRKRIENLDAQLTALGEIKKTAEAASAENRRLSARIEDLNAQLTALKALEKVVDEAATPAAGQGTEGESGREAARRLILGAVAFKQAVEREAGDQIAPGREQDKAVEFAGAWRALRSQPDGGGLAGLAKENRDLRAQAAWMRSQLDSRGGRDYPPCWAEESTGKPQYLFTAVLHDRGIALEPAWPPERSADAEKLPGLGGLVGAGILPVPAFRERLQGLDADSKTKECRHYVRLVNRVGSLATFNRERYAVEEFFYKFEVR